MDSIVIEGGFPLKGSVQNSGSKNASLPILAASLLLDQPFYLHNVPQLKDIQSMIKLLNQLGVCSESQEADGSWKLWVKEESNIEASYEEVRKMRASICVLGPLLAKRKRARVAFPGGCVIGPRPIDIHLRALKALGAEITVDHGYIEARAEQLKGCEIDLMGPYGSSVLATANALMAAVLAKGETTLLNAALEPEVVDLCHCLKKMGAIIEGIGQSVLKIQGVEGLSGGHYHVVPDRIEAGTYLLAGVISQGSLQVTGCNPGSLTALLSVLKALGQNLDVKDDAITVEARPLVSGLDIKTSPYPGFPTDLQAQLMAVLSLAKARSMITEGIYPDRFMHVSELNRLGAQISYRDNLAVIEGVPMLSGTSVMSSDLRASAALVLAGLRAEGKTIVHRVYHLDRGYEHLVEKLSSVGARIERVREEVAV